MGAFLLISQPDPVPLLIKKPVSCFPGPASRGILSFYTHTCDTGIAFRALYCLMKFNKEIERRELCGGVKSQSAARRYRYGISG